MGPDPPGPRSPRAAIACGAVGAGLAFLFHVHTGFVNDDALITIRYAENAARGAGFVYNEGERTLGTTTPLWAVLLTGFGVLGLPLPVVATVVGCLAHGVASAFAATLASVRGAGMIACLATGLAVAACPPLVQWAGSGMEAPLAVALLAAFLVAFETGRTRTMGWLGGLMMLTRPDLGLALASAAVLRVARTRSARDLLRAAPGFAAVVLPWIVWAGWYFGSPLPNSGFAKRLQVEDWGSYGAVLVRTVWERSALLPFAVVGIAAGLCTARALPALALGATVAGMHLGHLPGCGWYLPVPLYLVVLLGGLGAAEIAVRLGAASAPRALVLAVVAAPLTAVLDLPRVAHDVKIAQAQIERCHGRVGLWLRDHAPRDASVGVDNIGYIGYRSGLRVVDMLGLVQKEVGAAIGRGERDYALRALRPELIAIWWGRGNTWKYRPEDSWFGREGYRRVFDAPLYDDRPEPAYVVWSRIPLRHE